MVNIVKHDLEFILKQIKIAERHAAGEDLNKLVAEAGGTDPNSPASPQAHLQPYGLRTVDGSYNNLLPGRTEWGAADYEFKYLTDQSFRQGSGSFTYTSNNDYGVSGDVADAEPRLISNLIVDQTLNNPAALIAALEHAGVTGAAQTAAVQEICQLWQVIKDLDENSQSYASQKALLDAALEKYGIEMDGPTILLPNVAPDIGDSASYNSMFTLFGQFFDHGLDLVAKGGNGTVYIPLSPDDPLYNPNSPQTNFMVMTRASTGEDARNTTTPWVDQNQTYSSHASKQVFMREYVGGPDGKPANTGYLLGHEHKGMATWADVKEQARTLLGIELSDEDVHNVPLIAADEYGNFIPGPSGYPQLVVGFGEDGIFGTADDELVEGNPDNPVSPTAVGAFRTGHAFIDDIAHNAVPGTVYYVNGQPVVVQADDDDEAGSLIGTDNRGNKTAYDDELLDAHFVTGDGRGNENIGLTMIHHVFHSEHNRMVDETKRVALESGDVDFLNEWLLVKVTEIPSDTSGLVWDGSRLFQAARFVTEMEYQHLVFEEFARKMQPDVDAFLFEPDPDLDPAIFAEFANVVYRFGHSMLNENIERVYSDGARDDMTLFEAFLNPIAYDNNGTLSHDEAAGAIVRGMSGQLGNEIDEFVTNTLRNQLLGIPLDLAAINIARGRDTGMPTLNEARAKFQEMAFGDSQLEPYKNWIDFALNLKNPASIVNFIAAYGTHELIQAETTVEGKRAAAMAIVFGTSEQVWDSSSVSFRTIAPPSADDRNAFLNGTGEYAENLGGLNKVDLWVGGLAEKKMDFGGMLGSTFSFIFEMQLERLQDADRFYYLSRVQGLNLISELEGNSLAKMILRNTDLGEDGTAIPGDIFATPDRVLYVDHARQLAMTGLEDPEHENIFWQALVPMVERGTDEQGRNYLRYNGEEHVVIQGTDGDDHIIAGEGDDTIWGGKGNDRLGAGYGVDHVHGGEGDDIITNAGTDIGMTDFLHGEEGNDVIHGGSGLALLFGNQGKDFLIAGPDGKQVWGGIDDDFIMGGDGMDFLLGEAGDDWIEGGDRFDTLAGENSELFFNSSIKGNDVLNGQSGDTDYDAEAGDDIMFQGTGIQRSNGMAGFDWGIHKDDPNPANSDLGIPIFANQEAFILRDRFDLVEGLSGWKHDDTLTGRVVPVNTRVEATGTAAIPAPGQPLYAYSNALLERNVELIDGLDKLVGHLTAYEEVGRDGVAEMVLFETADASDMILGGGGSDRIKGLAGNDIIDGDKWLNVRIRITTDDGIYTADGMTKQIFREEDMVNGVLVESAVAQFEGKALHMLMLDGVFNPAQLTIVREIVDGNQTGDIDTSVYTDVRVNYAFGVNKDGSLYVEHAPPASDETDPLTDNIEGVTERPVLDGRDTVRNIERLEFTDMTMNVINGSSANETLNGDQAGLVDQHGNPMIHDVLMGFEGIDILNGGTGNDVLIGGADNDTLRGGAGDDIYVFGLTDGNDRIEDSSGNDRIAVSTDGQSLAALNFARANNGDLVISVNGNEIRVVGHFNGTSVETISFDGGDFMGYQLRLADDEGDEVFRGDFALSTAISADEAGVLTLRAEAGVSTILADAQGAGATTLLGDTGDDMLFGNNGADKLNGGAGADLLVGGSGNDTYIVDGYGDTVVEFGGGGTDTIEASIDSYTLDANVERLTYTGSGDFTGAGNELDNIIIGGVNGDSLYGEAGNDRLEGLEGDDYLDGGEGNDTLLGGEGDDYLVGGAGNDTLTAGNGNDYLDGGDGDDTLNGQDGDDIIRGGAGNDTINVGNGFNTIVYDTLDFGNDTVASFDANPTGGGQDKIDLRGLGITDANFEEMVTITADGTNTTVTIAGGGTITLNGVTGVGNNAITWADFILEGQDADPINGPISGTPGDDTLNGTSASDTILGGAGNDTINGLAGNDIIDGGAGDDEIFGGSGDDVIHWQAPNGGWDVVDGGSEGIAGDTFVITGDDSYEIFRFYPTEDATTDFPDIVLRGAATEIVVLRFLVTNGVESAPQVIAELSEIEEIVINGAPASGSGTSAGDRFEFVGDFNEQGEETNLRFNTITVNGSTGNDVVDISGLASAHRILFRPGGGVDTIIGALRPQDAIVLPAGTTLDDFDLVRNLDGTVTLIGENFSVTFTSLTASPQILLDDGEGSYAVPQPGLAPNAVDGEEVIGEETEEPGEQTGAPQDETPGGGEQSGETQDGDTGQTQQPPVQEETPTDTGNAPAEETPPAEEAPAGDETESVKIGGAGEDTLTGTSGRDIISGFDGNDVLVAGGGADMVFGGAGDDTILGEGGDDILDGGAGRDTVVGGAGNDTFVASAGDGDDLYFGDEGSDTLNMASVQSNVTADLGSSGSMGVVSSAETGTDLLWRIENITTGSGNDTIVASEAINVMDGGLGNDTFRFVSAAAANGDTIMGFQPGDRIDLSGIDANQGLSGNQSFTLVSGAFTGAAGELLITHENRDGVDYTVVQGNTSGGNQADFKFSIKGSHDLTASDFNL
ncbi:MULTISPECIES: peroxidase family protein [unclassified Aminobacter]|uniref:peroxidase family protein n=1 Tax=unclassified Aminobacter TaxID=2644704 RepID=UPI00046657E8|nr:MULTISPECIES: peroxidase family protein [unclassified Aminobacter]TWH32175.1 Ca2+-binding RTX toxin-like protein [Aminobacter sp. J15]